jgi:hypothetical protein
VTFDQLCHLMHPSTLQHYDGTRFLCTLSLAEGESLRAFLHARQGQLMVDGSVATCALHMFDASGGAPRFMDSSHAHVNLAATAAGTGSLLATLPSDGHFGTALQALRFLDSQHEYNHGQLTLLLRGLQGNPCSERQSFFNAVCASRRRVQQGWASRSVARVFGLDHELCILRQLSTMIRVRIVLTQRGLLLLDAFRAFNFSQNGLLTCSELYGALVWLGLQVHPADVHAMMRYMDKDGDGVVTYDEFRLAIGTHAVDEEHEWNDDLEDTAKRYEFMGLKPIPMPELADVEDESLSPELRAYDVPPEILGQIKCKVKKLDRFDEVWRSSGIAVKSKASIWMDRERKGMTQRNRLRVALGHYVSGSYAAPKTDRYTLELTDLSVSGLKHSKWLPIVVKQCLPHPVRFHRVWGIQTGAQHLFVWEPIPPPDHVALGMVASLTEDPPPDVRSVHCVPRTWVELAPDECKMLWSDAGASGKAGSLWACGTLQCLVASPNGQEPPMMHSFKLKHTRFTLGEHIVAGGDELMTPRFTEYDDEPQAMSAE